jgi:hypothetical protein
MATMSLKLNLEYGGAIKVGPKKILKIAMEEP